VTLLAASAVARRLADALEAASIEHGIGGALALGIWGYPRATNDVDLDVFVTAERLEPVLEVLQRAGCSLDPAAALRDAAERGDFRCAFAGVRVDVFVSSIPFYDSVRSRIRRAPLEGRPAWFLSPEDLVVFKLLFFRTKDVLDVERLTAFLGAAMDRAYVRRWLVSLVGEEDERVARWERVLADVDAT
jgi:hypothetical protein